MNSVELIRAILLKSRTIVSSGFDESLALLSCELPLTLCRFPSGGILYLGCSASLGGD